MKINNLILPKNILKTSVIATSLLIPTLGLSKSNVDNFLDKDSFEYSQASDTTAIVPKGTTNARILESAPPAVVFIKGEFKNAKIVIDLSQNALYQYDDDGRAICAYLVASGKKSTPTETGIREVSHVERYPYKNAYKKTRRYREPWLYGPRAIILNKLNPKTGEKSITGEFIHGTNNSKSLGKYASLGCIRMDNEVIKKIAQDVKKGDIIIIK